MANSNASAGHGGIQIGNLDPSLAKLIPDAVASTVYQSGKQVNEVLAVRPGVCASQVLTIQANVTNGDLITVGTDVFEVDIVNTDTSTTNSGAIDGTSDPVLVTLAAAASLTIAAGDLIRIGTEIMKVITAVDTKNFVVARGRCGTTKASHLTGQQVFQSDSAPTNIPVGLVTTLTAAVFGPAFAAEFNNAKSGTTRLTAKASTQFANFTAYSLQSGIEIVIVANTPGANTTATTDDMANSTDSVWGGTTVLGGVDSGIKAVAAVIHTFTAVEELVGQAHVAFPFTVASVHVQIRDGTTGQPIAFTGQIKINNTGLTDHIVSIINTGPASTAYITPFAAGQKATVVAFQ